MDGDQTDTERSNGQRIEDAKRELELAVRNALKLGFSSTSVRVAVHQGMIKQILTRYEVESKGWLIGSNLGD